MFVDYIKTSLTEMQIKREHADKFLYAIRNLKAEVVEDRKKLNLFEKLDANNRFEPVMASFIDKMMKDRVLGQYFHNTKMKHCVPNKIVLFFAYSKGAMDADDT
jgi:hypothetical protein